MTVGSFFRDTWERGDPVYRYGMLFVLIGLLAASVCWEWSLSLPYEPARYVNIAVLLMLLLNHLAFQFKWPVYATVSLRIVACVWMVCVAVYIVYYLLAR